MIAERVFDAPRERREELRRDGAVQRSGAGQIEKRLVDRQRLDERGETQHLGPHRTPDFAVFRHLRADHHRVGAQRERPEHRHRRAHAVKPRDIAAGQNDASRAAADDDRLLGEFRPVALFHRRVKGVAIEVRNREVGQLVMRDEARRAAFGAAFRRGRRRCQGGAVAAQSRGHSRSSGGHSQAAPRSPLESP